METASLETTSLDEERSMLETWTSTWADSFPSFDRMNEVISERHVTARDWQSTRFPGAADVLILGRILWASPWSFWGMIIGAAALLTGGRVQRSGRLVEFWGSFLPFFLKYFPFIAGSPVATFGHVVLGRTQRHLEACRPHQLVHMRQYECWGPLFVPVYLICGAVMWCVGKRPYYDNPFEREAFDETSDW